MTRTAAAAALRWRRARPLDRGPGDRNWVSADGRYRVRWRNRFDGVAVRPLYYALILSHAPVGPMWEIISTHRTARRARAACQRLFKS